MENLECRQPCSLARVCMCVLMCLGVRLTLYVLSAALSALGVSHDRSDFPRAAH